MREPIAGPATWPGPRIVPGMPPITLLIAASLLAPPGAPEATRVQPPAGPAFSTISGRPPEPPLRRVDPRIWEARFDASLWAPSMRRGDSTPLQLRDIRVWMPFVVQSTWSQVDLSSVRTEIWVQGRRHPSPASATSSKQGLPWGITAVGIAVDELQGQSFKWSVSWNAQCWASAVDEAAAAAVTWPAEWPSDARQGLEPEPGIEAGHADFKAFVDRVSKGKLRSVTPWIAAKELVRATITAFTSVDSDGIRVENGFPRGIVFNGAHAAMSNAGGSCHDLAAACVAVLRTAGIPSRVVLGAAEVQMSSGVSKARLVSWCEFWLPEAGWVPFSPNDMRGSIRGGLSVERPWPAFGTWDELNGYLPICFGFAPAVPGAATMPYPAGYAWTARGALDLTKASDAITIQIQTRGRPRP
jgi:hypothetical protein